MEKEFLFFLESHDGTCEIKEKNKDYIIFRYNQMNCVFEWDINDPGYYRIVLPNIDKYGNNKPQIMLDVTKSVKLVKCIENGGNVFMFVDGYVTNSIKIDSIFQRFLDTLEYAFQEYTKKIESSKNR